MKTYTTVDSTGEPLLIFDVPDHMVLAPHPGESIVEGRPPANSYWQNGSWISRPAQPTANHKWSGSTKEWIDPRTLQQRRDERWEALKAERQQRIDAGFTWNGYVFDSDEQSRGNISGSSTAATAALSAALPFSVIWTLKDNTTVRLEARQMIEVGLALMAHVDAQHAAARSLRLQIDAAQTPEEVDAVTWAEDDPSNASTAA